ncbi:glycosyltransferase family 2 protein [Nocardioides caldifontis]|uniref:glycosyltransferase family 2 protein n=1 Tax=Nocardioides caldifontis TaxID=2588938 RepID=UPI0013969025|nr:glycosyltransferase family 2 protein [Nocardioides caldifontis]
MRSLRAALAGAGGPSLSVVVPLHDTAAYVEECLDSLVDQGVDDLELVLVDDASTDDTLEVALRAARGRFGGVALRCDHRGPGGARNLGAAHATGTYLTFLDSDDAMLPGAYGELVATLEESGSDLATGAAVRGMRLADAAVPAWIAAVHRERRTRVRLEEFPEVTRDILTPSKVFRRSFWERAGLRFPERLRYEDQVGMTAAYLRAATIDVLERPAYFWRVRPDGTSITQGRWRLDDLQDRVATKVLTSREVEESGNAEVARVWRTHGLLGDLPAYLEQLPTCDDTYWALLRNGLRAVADHDVVAGCHLLAAHRLTASLVLDGDRDAATALVTHLREHPGGLDAEVVDGEVRAVVPSVVGPHAQPPTDVRRLRARDLGWGVDVVGVDVLDGMVRVAGRPRSGRFARLPDMALGCVLVDDAGADVELPVQAGGALHTVTLDPASLPTDGPWLLRFSARLGHLVLPQVPGAWQQVAALPEAPVALEVDAPGRRGLTVRRR